MRGAGGRRVPFADGLRGARRAGGRLSVGERAAVSAGGRGERSEASERDGELEGDWPAAVICRANRYDLRIATSAL